MINVGKAKSKSIRIIVGNTNLTATLYDNAAAKDFLSLLPLTLNLKDYAGTEKVSDLPKRLNTSDAAAGYKPSVGDITYYAPWGNLALFYKGFSYAGGLVPLGKLDNGIENFKVAGSINVKMELIS
jgi:hypothetical protein